MNTRPLLDRHRPENHAARAPKKKGNAMKCGRVSVDDEKSAELARPEIIFVGPEDTIAACFSRKPSASG